MRILNQPYASPTSIREIPEQLSKSFPARQIAYPMMMLTRLSKLATNKPNPTPQTTSTEP
ncbi:MAG: hypothetical protein LW699_04275 [Pirellula sp.]|nr:hypothetical protein [Pirellula sp.]